MTIRVRFAPSPTGHLHIGNARTALFNWLFARRNQGVFVLRIEDTDLARSEVRYEDLIYEDLKWLGMDWHEGPDKGGDFGPYRQSDRIEVYQEKAQELIRLGRAFYCFCSEAELEAQSQKAKTEGLDWKYPGTCQDLHAEEVESRLRQGEPAVIRLKVRPGPIRFKDLVHGEVEFASDVISAPILIRSNSLPTYNYAVVVDDALMHISHVIRGDDHLSNTPKQTLIYEAFGWQLPHFAHLSTILGSDHARLSKRHGAASVQNFQEMGILPEALMNSMALLGWAPSEGQEEILPFDAIAGSFELERVSKSAAVFDIDKLHWINRHYLKECDRRRLIALALPFLQKAGLVGDLDGAVSAWIGLLLEAVLPRIDHLSQIAEKASEVSGFEAVQALQQTDVREVLAVPGATTVIRNLEAEISQPSRNVVQDWKAIVTAVKVSSGQKGKSLFHPIRVALTGSTSGPELDKLVPLFETAGQVPLLQKIKNSRERVVEFVKAMDAAVIQ